MALVLSCYTKGDDHIGRVSFFEPGSYENGSVYNHGIAFKIAADCKLGRADEAYDSIRMMMPSNPDNPAEHSGVEPYAVTNMYLGPENKARAGESLMGWITGTAGWLYRCVTELIIGIQADYDGLRVVPCIPKAWNSFEVIRVFRGATYFFKFQRREVSLGEENRTEILCNGEALTGNLIPICAVGESCEIHVDFG